MRVFHNSLSFRLPEEKSREAKRRLPETATASHGGGGEGKKEREIKRAEPRQPLLLRFRSLKERVCLNNQFLHLDHFFLVRFE